MLHRAATITFRRRSRSNHKMSSRRVNRTLRPRLRNRSNTRVWAAFPISPALSVLIGGFSGWPSHPAGPQAARIAGEWWLFFYVSCAVYVVVMVVLVTALLRAPRATSGPETELPGPINRRFTYVVGLGVAITVVLLFVLLVSDFVTGRVTEAFGANNPLVIEIKGRQWWWEVNYADP